MGNVDGLHGSSDPALYDETVMHTPDVVGERVVLHAERLVPEVVRVRGRLALVSRRVDTVRKQIDVDVRHEELVVEYQDGDGTPMLDGPGPPVTIELHAEDVVVTKSVRVVERVTIATRPVSERKRFESNIRHEELVVPTIAD